MAKVDKAPRLSISIVIWILSSDTTCQLNQFNTNSEAAMLSRQKEKYRTATKLVFKFSPINIENGKAMSTLEHYFLTNKLLKINFNQGCNFELFV